MDGVDVKCQLCNAQCLTVAHLLRHLCLLHKESHDFEVFCVFDGCPRKMERPFRSYDNFRRHISNCRWSSLQQSPRSESHLPSVLPIILPQTDTEVDSGQAEAPCGEGTINEMDCGSTAAEVTCSQNQQSRETTDGLDVAAALFDLEESSFLTQEDIQRLLAVMQKLLDFAQGRLLARLSSWFEENGINLSESAQNHFRQVGSGVSREMFAGLTTPHLRRRFMLDNFGMVPPLLVDLPQTAAEKLEGQKIRNYAYIPLLDQIHLMLQNENFLREMTEKADNMPGLLRDISDGTRYQSVTVDEEADITFQLILYYDDVEPCNPIGSRNKVHKLGMFYFVVANSDPKDRSGLKCINLACIAKVEDIRRDSIDAILEPFVRDLRILEKGFFFSVNGKRIKVAARLCAVVADNLGSHILAGFKEGFTATRTCRFCMTTKETMIGRYYESEFQLRNEVLHAQQCAALNSARNSVTLYDHLRHVYGVNRDSILNSLHYFHVTDGGMAPDIMHDLLLGVLPLTIKVMLRIFIMRERYFSLKDLNRGIRLFKYGKWERRNKPSFIDERALTEKGHLRQSAAQCWQLSVMLPLIIGSFVPSGDKVYKCYLTLLEVCRLSFTREVNGVVISLLETAVAQYLEMYVQHVKAHLIPKQHNLVHYPRLMQLLGPLTNVWAMRYEAKNGWFKKLARIIGNFTNLPLTVAERQQKLQALHLFSYGRSSVHKDKKKATLVNVSSMPWGGQLAMVLGLETLPNTFQVTEVKGISVGSRRYDVDAGFISCRAHIRKFLNVPEFGRLKNIYVIGDRVYFNLEMWVTVKFSDHFQAFEVRERVRDRTAAGSHFTIVELKTLLDTTLYHEHDVFLGTQPLKNPYLASGTDRKFIALKQYTVNSLPET